MFHHVAIMFILQFSTLLVCL